MRAGLMIFSSMMYIKAELFSFIRALNSLVFLSHTNWIPCAELNGVTVLQLRVTGFPSPHSQVYLSVLLKYAA